ncbi:MAG: ABC transporter ATP-binding protein, partial [Gaiellaceae bacterium]|nr:ABC transporter ATP-binding protein [Gaiellaceae bacterium]
MSATTTSTALEVEDLEVVYRVRGIDRPVLRRISLSIEHGRSYGLVGESGCGKSTAALAIVRYLPRNGRVTGGSISVAGRDVLGLRGGDLRDYHARSVSMVYQNPGAALNPSMRIGQQIAEAFTALGAPRGEAAERAREALVRVQIADPESVLSRFPHQLSGGMQQRVVIAMALAKDPALLILDEPTTGLDATVEAEVLDLVAQLQAEIDTAVLFISHNLGVISKMCDRVGVLYAGRLVEEGPVEEVLQNPRHPYTVGLLRCIPRGGVRKDHGRLDTIPGFLPALGEEISGCVFAERCGLADDRCRAEEPPLATTGTGHVSRCWYPERARELPREEAVDLELPGVDRRGTPLVEVRELSKVFRERGHDVHALAQVSLAIWPGETLGLVGESGSGKTTLARTLLGIVPPSAGTVTLAGNELPARYQRRSKDELRALQIVFQNPDSALNRRHSLRRILLRALRKLAGLTGR